ncbi:unnamed protein product [Dovyalis caffra]|uniref:Uncharacterized protein n=1 Tax=Dovyalis caffra TaxID=77055 RepID=A0AAV1RJQ7_9ROSI|nr:unnamed protein product [Dovyalis caffra]
MKLTSTLNMKEELRRLRDYLRTNCKICRLQMRAGLWRRVLEVQIFVVRTNVLEYHPESITNSIQKQIVGALQRGERSRASTLLLELGQEKHVLCNPLVYNAIKHTQQKHFIA